MKLNQNNIFVDTNVLIGAYAGKQNDIIDSLDIGRADMEDNIQYVLSRKLKCFFFVTNNKKDYTDFLNIKTLNSPNIRLIKRN